MDRALGWATGATTCGGGTRPHLVALAQLVLRVLQGEPVGVELVLQSLVLGPALGGQLLQQAGLRLRPVQDAGQLLILFFLLHDGLLVGLQLAVHGLGLVPAFSAEGETAKPVMSGHTREPGLQQHPAWRASPSG